MNNFTRNKVLRLIAVSILWIGSTTSAFGQAVYTRQISPGATPKPLVQQPSVPANRPTPQTSAIPLVNKTGSSAPSTAVVPVARRTSFAALANIDIPGYSGILVEDLDGNIVFETASTYTFNPASNVKIATAYAVLKTFGPEYRFPTSVWTDGQIDTVTGTLYGNLYVSGRDPMFNLEHGIAVANELNRLGVRSVSGDLIVTDNFTMSFNTAAQRSGQNLTTVMNSAKRTAAATRSWQNYLVSSKKIAQVNAVPSVSITGGVYTQTLPTNARLLFSHESTPLREIVKTTLCYSNNFLSERLGDMLGGPYAVARIVQQNAQIAPHDFSIQTASGLGINRVTPRAMMKLLKAFRTELARNKMNFTDIMPVAGIDKGTLEGRFNADFARGSVVGKTGTLGQTDSGVSSLAGEIQTRNGKFLFVIFNQRGSVSRFRGFQNSLVALIQGQLGGAAPMAYMQIPLDVRLANTRITYPDTRARINE